MRQGECPAQHNMLVQTSGPEQFMLAISNQSKVLDKNDNNSQQSLRHIYMKSLYKVHVASSIKMGSVDSESMSHSLDRMTERNKSRGEGGRVRSILAGPTDSVDPHPVPARWWKTYLFHGEDKSVCHILGFRTWTSQRKVLWRIDRQEGLAWTAPPADAPCRQSSPYCFQIGPRSKRMGQTVF